MAKRQACRASDAVASRKGQMSSRSGLFPQALVEGKPSDHHTVSPSYDIKRRIHTLHELGCTWLHLSLVCCLTLGGEGRSWPSVDERKALCMKMGAAWLGASEGVDSVEKSGTERLSHC